jgi:hemin uptake protein HemP
VSKQTPGPRPVAESNFATRLGARPARIPSGVVLGGDNEVVIVHGRDEYLLRIGEDGKLVLSR